MLVTHWQWIGVGLATTESFQGGTSAPRSVLGQQAEHQYKAVHLHGGATWRGSTLSIHADFCHGRLPLKLPLRPSLKLNAAITPQRYVLGTLEGRSP